MLINNLELYNFGSYEGKAYFNFEIKSQEKNIILIGGKNGAGKTTLFNAIRLGIYGYKAFGYQSINAFYNRAIIKCINNNAKLEKVANSYIKLSLSISNGQSLDSYVICRKWTLENNTILENLQILKNGNELNEEETFDFEKYLMQIIPPDLFDLYFFDGEKIADFFMEEGGKARIKKAFLTLCGYDIFEIMNNNFKKMQKFSGDKDDIAELYTDKKIEVDKISQLLQENSSNITENKKQIDGIDAQVKHMEQAYKKRGGIEKNDWDNKFDRLKAEENYRDNANIQLKKFANEYLPFLILEKQISELEVLVKNEAKNQQYKTFNELLKNKSVVELFVTELNIDKNKLNHVFENINKKISSEYINNMILDLSTEQSAALLYQIKNIKTFDCKEIYLLVDGIKKSIKKSQSIRKEIEKCNIDKVEDYVKQKNQLLNDKFSLLNQREYLIKTARELDEKFQSIISEFTKIKKEYENKLKNNSISNISSRAILMLDKLEEALYQVQINKVERVFKESINELMRKEGFIDNIEIDKEFNISIYRYGKYSIKQINDFVSHLGYDKIEQSLGKKANNKIKKLMQNGLFNKLTDTVELEIELDKNLFSNGEKQIYIMALYKSLMYLCRSEVPFVIDTPFARIDTEHRNNISKYFFSKLKGQIFILSTNEEIEKRHIDLLKDKLAVTYILENKDNKKTQILRNTYFEEVENVS